MFIAVILSFVAFQTTPCVRGSTLWGIDAGMGAFPDSLSPDAEAQIVKGTGIKWIRSRGLSLPEDPRSSAICLACEKDNLSLVAFATLPSPSLGTGRQLPDDLIEVYSRSKQLAATYRGRVRAWEMIGEPDVGYCTDLPEHVVAVQKAMYLGLKAGDPSAIVLMGALALPPGPWLHDAIENSLLSYTDGYNFHYYGLASDFRSVIKAHRAVVESRSETISDVKKRDLLPIWITECGYKAVLSDALYDVYRRGLQGSFAEETASIAESEADVAVFMPFIMAHTRDPYSMVDERARPFVAWDKYKDCTNRLSGNRDVETNKISNKIPTVLEWLPDPTSCFPDKISRSNRFKQGSRTMFGSVVIYNLTNCWIHGRLSSEASPGVKIAWEANQTVDIAPMSSKPTYLAISRSSVDKYFRSRVKVKFENTDNSTTALAFNLEAAPSECAGVFSQPSILPVSEGSNPDYYTEFHAITSSTAHWRGINGLLLMEPSTSPSGNKLRIESLTSIDDPLRPQLAIANVEGIPKSSVIRVILSRPIGPRLQLRFDLVDSSGQRFCIWENSGSSYGSSGRILWLNVNDLNLFFWGRCLPDTKFDSTKIVQIQIRFYFKRENEPVDLSFDIWRAVN